MRPKVKKEQADLYSRFLFTVPFLITVLLATSPARAQFQEYIHVGDKSYKAYRDEKTNLWGFQEVKGKLLEPPKYKVHIKAQFDEIANQALKTICAVKKNGKWGYINMKGDMVVPFQYEEANESYVKNNGKWGMIDEQGNVQLACIYHDLRYGGIFNIASSDGIRYGYIDNAGKTVIPFMYEECYPMRGNTEIVKTATGYEMKSSSAIAKVKIDGRYGVIDAYNKYVLYPKFKDINDDWQYNSPYLRISMNGNTYGVADRRGNFLMPTYFKDMLYIDNDGTAKARLYDKSGNFVAEGTVNVNQHTFKVGGKIHTYDRIGQNYLTKKDSIAFGLYRDRDIKSYQAAPSGYLAYLIAGDLLSDSLRRETSWPGGISWLQKGVDTHHDVLCAVRLSDILYAGTYDQPKDVNKAYAILFNGMSYLLKNPAVIDSYNALESDEDEQQVISEVIDDGFLRLAQYYITGVGTEKNEREAINWYEKGAKFGSPSCAMALGDLYYSGSSILAKDPTKALSYYENNPGAAYIPEFMYKAAKMYLDGIGTSKNREKALGLLRKAASLYHTKSKELLAQLGEK